MGGDGTERDGPDTMPLQDEEGRHDMLCMHCEAPCIPLNFVARAVQCTVENPNALMKFLCEELPIKAGCVDLEAFRRQLYFSTRLPHWGGKNKHTLTESIVNIVLYGAQLDHRIGPGDREKLEEHADAYLKKVLINSPTYDPTQSSLRTYVTNILGHELLRLAQRILLTQREGGYVIRANQDGDDAEAQALKLLQLDANTRKAQYLLLEAELFERELMAYLSSELERMANDMRATQHKLAVRRSVKYLNAVIASDPTHVLCAYFEIDEFTRQIPLRVFLTDENADLIYKHSNASALEKLVKQHTVQAIGALLQTKDADANRVNELLHSIQALREQARTLLVEVFNKDNWTNYLIAIANDNGVKRSPVKAPTQLFHFIDWDTLAPHWPRPP